MAILTHNPSECMDLIIIHTLVLLYMFEHINIIIIISKNIINLKDVTDFFFPKAHYASNLLTGKYGDGGGLSSSIVAQESSDLTLIHVEAEFIHCNLLLTVTRPIVS